MIDHKIFGVLVVAFGAWIIASRRAFHSWYSNVWRLKSNATDSWFAALLGPRIVSACFLVLGAYCLVAGVMIALGIA